jgi:phosphinothricin acetyltransferase
MKGSTVIDTTFGCELFSFKAHFCMLWTMEIREMRVQDWPMVATIFQQGIDTKVATFQHEVPDWTRWDATHIASCRLVALDETEGVIGWAALSPVSSRVAYRGVAEVSIYVLETHRGKSVGKRLLEQLVRASEQAGYWMLQSVVLVENHASIALHQSCGFRTVGRREKIGRLPDGTWSDTLLLELRSRHPDFLD